MNGLERLVQEELTRVPPGPSADALRRRARVRRTRRTGGAVAALAIVLAGLGAGAWLRSPTRHRVQVTQSVPKPTTKATSSSTAPRSLRAAALAWSNAFLTGTPDDILALDGPQCRPATSSTINARAAAAELQQLRDQIQLRTGLAPDAIKIRGVLTRNVTANRGEAEVQYDLPQSVAGNDNWVTYEVHEGQWKVADCNAPIGGNSSSKSSTATTVAK